MSEGETALEKAELPLKTVVIICMCLISWVGSLATVYFTMKAKVDTATDMAQTTKERLDRFNPDIIVYQVNELRDQVKKSNDKADYIISLLNGNPPNGQR